ncbi:MAG: hypothetical protein M3Y87_30300 [Myxococcota bacterium]|nr:hypothetical protein [Myxococcota bacterium]
MRLVVLLAAVVMVGCSMSHEAAFSGDAAVCAASFDDCERDEDCCAGNYCSGPYGPTVCTPTSADGAFCVDAQECESATCVENLCGGVVTTCIAAGDSCGDAECCAGASCRVDASGAARCLPPSPDGEPCADASECVTGQCTDGLCGAPPAACLEGGGGDCRAPGARCCEGSYCELSGYLEGHCSPYALDGEWCAEGIRRCASGICAEGICRSASCRAVDTECGTGTHGECCSGFCDFGFSYGAGVCRARLPAGEPCYDAAWCVSGSCGEDLICD